MYYISFRTGLILSEEELFIIVGENYFSIPTEPNDLPDVHF